MDAELTGLERAFESALAEAGGDPRAIDEVHAQGGIAIAAHPTRDYSGGWDDEAIARLDGVEAAHPALAEGDDVERDFAGFVERARALNPGIAAIGSSDFHVHDRLGRCRTYVFAHERSAAAVIEAVRAGRTVAESADGRLFAIEVGSASLYVFAIAVPSGACRLPVVLSWYR